MYPETDVPPIEISSEKIKEIDENLPKTLKERKKEYLKEIGEEMAEQIINSRKLKEYEKYKKEANPKLVANVLLNILPRLKSEGLEIDKLEEKDKLKIFKAYSEDRVNKNDIPRILEKKIKEESTQIEEIIEKEIKEKADEDEIRKAVNQVIQSKEELIKEKGKHAQGALMGLVMEKIDAEGDKVSEILSNELKNKLD